MPVHDIRPIRALCRCVYCGERAGCRRRPRTCHGHQDLPRLDPRYAPEQRKSAA